MSSKSSESFSNGINASTKHPILFIPALAPIIIQLLFLLLAIFVFPVRYGFYPIAYYDVPNPILIWAGYFIAWIVGFIALCTVVYITDDIINSRTIDLNKSINSVINRLGTLILAAIISAIFSITFVLIPIAFFIITISILESKDAIESTKVSFNFVSKNLSEVLIYLILIIIISIIVNFGFSMIPFIGSYLGAIISWILNVFFTVTSVYFYLSLKK